MLWPEKGQGAAAGLAGWAQQAARHQELLPCACHAPCQSFLPSATSSGLLSLQGSTAVGQNDLVSHCLDIHSALLVLKLLGVLAVFLI